jgi:hypothetical protein
VWRSHARGGLDVQTTACLFAAVLN